MRLATFEPSKPKALRRLKLGCGLWEQEEARAALPGMLRQAAKDGHVEDYDDDDGNPCQGMETILAEGIEVDGVDDQGYTALVRLSSTLLGRY